MFPDFQYLFQTLFNAPMPEWLSIIKTFGFFVALAFIAAAITLGKELTRKEKLGLLLPEFKKVLVGQAATKTELFLSALLGFVVGYKIGGFFGHAADISPDPMTYVFSLKGNIFVGIAGAALLTYSRYAEKKKHQLAQPELRQQATYPHDRIADIVVITLIGGLIGAKVFNAFESWDQFVKDPVGNLISSSGLTFYGGFIVAIALVYYYAKRHRINLIHLSDAGAPGLMLAYGIGRLGCQFSGDGDWGIFNSAYMTAPGKTSLMHIDKGFFDKMVANHSSLNYLSGAPSTYFKAPSWLPDWTVAMNFPHNVNHEGIAINGCTGTYCNVLPAGVFPTSLYEAITCILLFVVLWSIRKRMKYPLHLFGIYLILNGLERFFVEKIRVNYKYDLGFIHPTQAEIISTLLVIAGLCILLFYKKKAVPVATDTPLTE